MSSKKEVTIEKGLSGYYLSISKPLSAYCIDITKHSLNELYKQLKQMKEEGMLE